MLIRYGPNLSFMSEWIQVNTNNDEKAISEAYSMACSDYPPSTKIHINTLHENGHRGSSLWKITVKSGEYLQIMAN